MDIYIVRNKEGKFFRAKGRDGYGDSWVDDIKDAKIYTKKGSAEGRVTFWYKNYPDFGCPEILTIHFEEGDFKVLDMKEKTDKKVKKINEKALQREKEHLKWKRDRLLAQHKEIEEELSESL